MARRPGPRARMYRGRQRGKSLKESSQLCGGKRRVTILFACRWAAQMAPGAATMHKKTAAKATKMVLSRVLGRFPRSVSVALPRVPPLTRAFASRIAIPRFGRASLLHVVCRVVRSRVACLRSHSLSPSPWCSAAPVHLHYVPAHARALSARAPPRASSAMCAQATERCGGSLRAPPVRARAVERPPGVALCGA